MRGGAGWVGGKMDGWTDRWKETGIISIFACQAAASLHGIFVWLENRSPFQTADPNPGLSIPQVRPLSPSAGCLAAKITMNSNG